MYLVLVYHKHGQQLLCLVWIGNHGRVYYHQIPANKNEIARNSSLSAGGSSRSGVSAMLALSEGSFMQLTRDTSKRRDPVPLVFLQGDTRTVKHYQYKI